MSESEKDSEWAAILDGFKSQLKETAQLIVTNLEGESFQTELFQLKSTMKLCEESRRRILHQHCILNNIKQTLNAMEKPWEYDIRKAFHDQINSSFQRPNSDSNSSRSVEDYFEQLQNDELTSQFTPETHKKTYLDPWTKLPIQDPVQSDSCKHFYERNIVKSVLKNKKLFKCPYVGCIQTINESNIIEVNF